jgi:hypothetical protein
MADSGNHACKLPGELTFRHQLISINPTLNLSPERINRLVALKSLLDLGDMDLVSAASSRLESSREAPEIAAILDTLADHRYAEAYGMIGRLVSDASAPRNLSACSTT